MPVFLIATKNQLIFQILLFLQIPQMVLLLEISQVVLLLSLCFVSWTGSNPSKKNEKKRYLVPHLEKNGFDLSCFHMYQSKQFISIMALMKLAQTWKTGSKAKRQALLDEIPSAIENVAFKYKTRALSPTEPPIKCEPSVKPVLYLQQNHQ